MEGKKCGEPCEVWSRVVGYYRPVNGWNPGKQDEFKSRSSFKISEGAEKIPETPKETK